MKTFFYQIYLRYLKSRNMKRYAELRGVRMGERCKIVNSSRTSFGSEPYLIKLGSHVEVSGNVTFITHDGAAWVTREQHPDLDVFGTIKIGNNVFIGNGSILLPGTEIGDNCVVGAGSLVRGKLEGNSIYAGVPVRRIRSMAEYTEKIISLGLPTKGFSIKEKKSYLLKHFSEFFEEE